PCSYAYYLLSSTEDLSKQASSLYFLSPVKTSANRCKRMMPFPVFLDTFPAEGFTFRVSSQVNDTQINAKGSTCLMRGRGRYFEGGSQVEDALTVDQIGLPLDLVKSRLLILSHTEGNEHTSRE